MIDAPTKAYQINQDPSIYGTIAEIGAGQEVARAFFKAGGASRTVAKSMSAYDMVISDNIYGETSHHRYVSQERLQAMLDHEYDLLVSRLERKRALPSRFFAFANTVTTKSVKQGGESHGWVGLRFQAEPGQAASTVQLHLRMLDRGLQTQRDALGKLGVNLIYGCYFQRESWPRLVSCLLDDVGRERLEIDFAELSGPAFGGITPVQANLHLIEAGAGRGFVAKASGRLVPPCEAFFGKAIFSVRGSFYPFSLAHQDMIESGRLQFSKECALTAPAVSCFLELTLDRIEKRGGGPLWQQLEHRLQAVHAMGYDVAVTGAWSYDDLVCFYRRYTTAKIGLGIGIRNLARLFQNAAQSPGDILGFFGRIFQKDATMYVYPWLDRNHLEQIRYDHPDIPANFKNLFHHLADNRHIRNIESYQAQHLDVLSSRVLKAIADNDLVWQKQVPEPVAALIERGIM